MVDAIVSPRRPVRRGECNLSDGCVQARPGRTESDCNPTKAVGDLGMASDWTDSAHKAGCIESAVLPGVQAAKPAARSGR